ncbi:hypothetical protein PLICRDRAFT_80721, partial [Plicaturopsis crispa FD-325 SS-3]
FSSVDHRAQMVKLQSYVAAATYLSSVGWKQAGSGNRLIDAHTGDEAVSVVVGKVIDTRLNCSPTGNYNGKFGKLQGAKYTFTIGVPDEPAFLPDFKKAVDNLRLVENTVAQTNDHRNFV